MKFDRRERAQAWLAGMAHPMALMLALGWLTPEASAQSTVAPPFAALFQQAQATAPRLAESQASIRVAEGLALQAGLRPNPSAGLGAASRMTRSPRCWNAMSKRSGSSVSRTRYARAMRSHSRTRPRGAAVHISGRGAPM